MGARSAAAATHRSRAETGRRDGSPPPRPRPPRDRRRESPGAGENPDDPRRAEYATPLDDDDEDRPHDSVSEAAEKAFNDLLEWRLEYQAYRAGAARGARGRASGKSYPLETLRMLPVARLAAHHRAEPRGYQTVSLEDAQR